MLLPLLAAIAITLSSCVYDREMAYFNRQINSLNRKVSDLQESAGSDLPDRLDAIQTSQAQLGLELDQVKEEVSRISGRSEENSHLLKRIVEEDLSRLDALSGELESLSREVEALDSMVRQQQAYLGLEAPPEQPLAPPELALEREKSEGPAPTELEPLPSGENELYEHARSLYRDGRYEKAMAAFEAFLEKFPESEMADNAHFWIAECHMSREHFEEAILAYQKVIKDYPKGNKVANSMYRQAMAFLEIKDKTSARLLLKKITEEFPDANEAELASKKLEAMD
ncbi:MAG: tol-pal system protein YbgF [Desulfobacteraceae bacterium]